MESSVEWLHRTLMRICCHEAEPGMQFDPETVDSLVTYCKLATPDDAAEYLTNIVTHPSCAEVVKEYLQRRGNPGSAIKNEAGGSTMQVYQKSQAEDIKPSRQQRRAKQRATAQTKPSDVPAPVPAASTTVTPPGSSQQSSRNKRGPKPISMAEARKLVDFRQGKPCECQATKHGLINNCLSCGKIVCQQEGEGPCNFCGALVLREGSNYAGLDGTVIPTTESEAAAQAFKDRLVDYDRNAASRTTVIDDQSDFFDATDVWISQEDKDLLRKKQEEVERAAEERRKRVVVNIDLLGRKVVMASGGGTAADDGMSILMAPEQTNNARPFRVTASPSVKEPPVYVHTGTSKNRTNKAKSGPVAITGRVQYDDTMVTSRLGSVQVGDSREWIIPDVSHEFEDASESFECA